jgi:opacity protein-like surface antigen
MASIYIKPLLLALLVSLTPVASTSALTETADNSLAPAEKILYDWTGAYAGVNLGAVWTGSKLTAANESAFLSDSSSYNQQLNNTSVNPGLQFGYFKQLTNHWVVGGEGDFTYPATASQYQNSSNDGSGAFDKFTVHNNLQGSLRLRAGYAIDLFLPFVTAGVSFASLGLNYNSEADAYAKTTTQTGWVLGGGLEYGVLKNLSVRTEYLYADYGSALSLNIPTAGGLSDPTGTAQATLYTNVLRAAVNYRF